MLAFLRDARYPTLAHRFGGVGMCYADVGATRAVSFEFVNRQLVWSGFAEFLVFLSPVVASSRVTRVLWRAVGAILPREQENGTENGSPRAVADRSGGSSERGCGICGNGTPVMPYLALPCRHKYCYVCIAVAVEKEPSLACTRCGVAVHAISRATATGCM
jgi:peroxin-2